MALPNPPAGTTPAREQARPTLGIPDALLGWLGCWLFAQVAALVVLSIGGFTTTAEIKAAPLTWTMGAGLFIWLAFVPVAIWLAQLKGAGWIREYHVAIKAVDVPAGLVAGVIAQFVLVPLVAWPVFQLSGKTADDLSGPAQDLADKAHGAGGALLLLLVVGVVAPLAEELFFRGLVFRAFEKRWNQWAALALSSAFFAFTHFQLLQFLPLVAAGAVFGLLVIWTDRLGPAVVAHMAFNISTVVVLLWTN